MAKARTGRDETDADAGRLRWLCRRGMRELDSLLGRYLAERYDESPAPVRRAFARLLERSDDELWDWLSGRGRPADAALRDIVERIRDHAAH